MEPVDTGTVRGINNDHGISPDGKWIYLNSNRSGSWDIWRIPADGAGPEDAQAERVTSDDLEDWFPHISPDGKMMVFISFEKGIPDHPPNKNVAPHDAGPWRQGWQARDP